MPSTKADRRCGRVQFSGRSEGASSPPCPHGADGAHGSLQVCVPRSPLHLNATRCDSTDRKQVLLGNRQPWHVRGACLPAFSASQRSSCSRWASPKVSRWSCKPVRHCRFRVEAVETRRRRPARTALAARPCAPASLPRRSLNPSPCFAAGQQCATVPNTEWQGKEVVEDLYGMMDAQNTAQDCCTRCRNTPRCEIWAWCDKADSSWWVPRAGGRAGGVGLGKPVGAAREHQKHCAWISAPRC